MEKHKDRFNKYKSKNESVFVIQVDSAGYKGGNLATISIDKVVVEVEMN